MSDPHSSARGTATGAVEDAGGGAAIVVRRSLAWAEVDGASHNHFSALFRWLEDAEHQLYRCLGFDREMIARVPRVHLEVDYSARIRYGDEIEVRVQVRDLGRASCTYGFSVDRADGERAASGRYVVVHVADTSSGSAPWPEQMRAALSAPVTWRVEPTIGQV